MKKIAVPTKENLVDDHFGHCDAYTVFSINQQNQIEGAVIVPSPAGCGCKSNIASTLQQLGVTTMLAGNMGDGALNKLKSHGIDVLRGCSGNVRVVVENFISGKTVDSGIGCSHNHEGGEHSCNHGS
ncbi:NifB/NifX family molybdenum-iron cluster-binding protein [Paludibacter jiangxiensis]|uniref:Predicted Fe-Mo cluster-binding protein, NifX family n=1 Tax=Paludibacter jiangxiensis TaxID=681398 RepID=A0A170YSY7_9BACT|nr:NifB/NifX family molybdenum-iron cluster-binding protein [Paludibacter jiangxiensis]GAT62041.1 predicted Fe-Mo cluster-binding protein, NifX family [Paludibacter jiangxiensis]